jgi:selenocysteine-specific elongation factor
VYAAAPLTIGTTGHVDHGKTTLVRALTGTDTDRLPQEKERGLSIELGYARLELPTGRQLSVVDVPGHERFIRTMVAGATGIDAFLLCVAADDGFMPQTREHLAVLRALGVGAGVAAITKADLADTARAAAQVADELPGVEAIPVAAHAGRGLRELLAALGRATANVDGRGRRLGPAKLHVDRVFTLHGIGTVATGTLWSGSVAPGQELLALPHKQSVRIRSVQVHDVPVERADASQRVAVALTGAGRRKVGRGDVLCDPAAGLVPSFRVNALLELNRDARPVLRGTRVQVHHGTRDTPARVVPLEGDRLHVAGPMLCQLRLEAPLIADRADALVLRQIAPPDTIGGGTIVDPRPRRQGPTTAPRITHGSPRSAPRPPKETDTRAGEAALRLASLLQTDGERPRSDNVLRELVGLAQGDARAAWRAAERAGLAVRVGANLHFDPAALRRMSNIVTDICRREGSVTIARARDQLGTSRRHAQALLEHLDAEYVTVREGDVHRLRLPRTPSSGS